MMKNDIPACKRIVQSHWGEVIANQAGNEMAEMFSGCRWPPEYIVGEDEQGIAGFAGYKSAWLMSNTYELIWINVRPDMIGTGLGRMLTVLRISEIQRLGGRLILLMTQKPGFFARFDFIPVANLDNWFLMLRQLGPIELDDRP